MDSDLENDPINAYQAKAIVNIGAIEEDPAGVSHGPTARISLDVRVPPTKEMAVARPGVDLFGL